MSSNSAANSAPHPTLIEVDPFIPADQQKGLHNRWHPDIPSVATVKPGQVSFLSLTAEIQLETLSDVQSAMRRLGSPIIFATIKDLTILGIRLDWWPNWQQ
ncbi:hypothetical protein Ac2012v2_8356 [Leucoagaricus gongylophorus]